jgi:two-component system LytT family sensor kinase
MKKSIVIAIHAMFWIAYLFLLLIIVVAATQGFSSGINLLYISKIGFSFAVLPVIISFYLFYFYLFENYIKTKRIAQAFVFGTLFCFSSAIVGGLFLYLLFDANFMFRDGFISFFSEIIFMMLLALFGGVMSILIKGFITGFDEIRLKEELTAKNYQMELTLLKSQLDPHFLFNTINNIDALILKDQKIASEYLNKLSDILRFMLFEAKTEKIYLSKEIEYIEKYIALQKTRTSNDNFVSFKLTEKVNNMLISPMILIPFIENAFKHTSNKKIDSAITISVVVENNTIVFECQNKYDTNYKSHTESNGLGNDLISKRIQLLYPEKQLLVVTDHNNSYNVKLTLNND